MSGSMLPQPKPTSLLASVFANTAWMLGGKGFGAVCSLVYLAILTRSLGLKAFGHFSLILGTSQAFIAIAGFQTWRIVVRYGAHHAHRKDWAAFGRLAMFAGSIDVMSAVLGSAIAYVVIIGFGEQLDINPSLATTVFWFNVASLWAISSAPTGIVRALDRFDTAVYVEAIVPSGRLVAAVVIWLTGPSLARFLIAWALIDLFEAALYWETARRICPDAIKLRRLKDWRRARTENPGIGHFALVNYLAASLAAAIRSGPLLAIGYFVGTSSAGLYRLADQLAQGLSKLSTLLTRATYAEISRASVVAEAGEFRNLTLQTTGLAGAAGLVVVGLAVALGGTILEAMGGPAFRRGYVILVPLTIAASLELASVAFEPVLHATGRARAALVARLLGLAGLVAVALVLHAQSGATIAWSVAIGGAVTYFALALLTFRTLRRL